MHLSAHPAIDTSRRDTTHERAFHLSGQLPLGADLGRRSWVHRALHLRVAESRRDRAEVSDIVMRRHYLQRRATPPRVLVLSYLATLGGEDAAAMVQVALLPTNLGALLPTLNLHPCSVLQMVRSWRADDLTPDIAPDMMPEFVRRVVRRLPADWSALKCKNLQAVPRLLVSYADPGPGVQHDGGLYLGAGAVPLGPGRGRKLLFAWPLDPTLRQPLRSFAERARA